MVGRRGLPPGPPPGEEGNHEGVEMLPAPDGMFRCPNGHDMLGALVIQGISEQTDGTYCMACYWQFIVNHTPRVELIRFDD